MYIDQVLFLVKHIETSTSTLYALWKELKNTSSSMASYIKVLSTLPESKHTSCQLTIDNKGGGLVQHCTPISYMTHIAAIIL